MRSGDHPKCRVLIIGGQLARVEKVISLLKESSPAEEGIEYLASAANFKFYKAEGKRIKYLVRLESSEVLLPPIDEDSINTSYHLAGVALGCGVFDKDDVERIQKYFDTLYLGSDVPPVRVIRPNEGYATMMQENGVYKNLSDEEKEKATADQTMGPGKMAKFVREFAMELVSR